jgi:hypothetical protein
LHPGENLEADGRTIPLGENSQELEVRTSIRYCGWTLHLDQPARLTWPVRPFNPYRNAPETGIEHAVGALATDLDANLQTVKFVIDTL